MVTQLLNNPISKFLSTLLFLSLSTYFFITEITTFVNTASLSGYSMIEVVNSYNGNLDKSTNGFISTGYHKTVSLISWIYIGVNNFFNIQPLNINYFFIIFEFLLIPFSAFYFLKTLQVKNPVGLSLVYTAIILFTNIQQNNWANYGKIFNGEWYNIPNSLFLIGLALILNKQYEKSVFLLLLTLLIHPSKGLIFILILGPVIIYNLIKDEKRVKSTLFSIFASSLIAILYLYFFIFDKTVSTMDPNLWIQITDSHSYHFLRLNFFEGDNITRYFLPILFFTFSITLNFRKTVLFPIGIIMLTISIAGKIIDTYSSYPSFISLGIHRLTENIILLGIVTLLVRGRHIAGISIFSFLAVYIYTFEDISFNKYMFFVLSLLLLLAFKNKFNIIYLNLLSVFLILQNENLSISDNKYFFQNDVIFTNKIAMLMITIFIFIFFLSDKIDTLDWSYLYLVFILLFCINIFNTEYKDKDSDEIFSNKTNGYYEVQIWANVNTLPDSIFMPDPYISYAWRDFSNRNSFGTPREFVTSWLYTRNIDVFNDSLLRTSVFINEPLNAMINLQYDEFINVFSEKYYLGDLDIYKKLCQEFEVDYFVWSNKFEIPNYFKVVYVSESHSILQLVDNCK